MTGMRIVSLMADNSDSFYRELGQYLSGRTGIQFEVVSNVWWRQRERMLDEGLAQVGFVCGLQYVWRVDPKKRPLELLAAPIMQGRRYRGKPIYFSDVVAHRESAFRSFDDLRGCIWACNEPTSHSGFNLIRYCLAARGATGSYFGEVIESGSHQNSLALLLNRRIDATAIDSTVLELELRRRPELRRDIRVIETLGPSPIPPAVILTSVAEPVRRAVRKALWLMHEGPDGRAVLDGLSVASYTPVQDSDYEPIRRMAREASQVSFSMTQIRQDEGSVLIR